MNEQGRGVGGGEWEGGGAAKPHLFIGQPSPQAYTSAQEHAMRQTGASE